MRTFEAVRDIKSLKLGKSGAVGYPYTRFQLICCFLFEIFREKWFFGLHFLFILKIFQIKQKYSRHPG